MIEDLRSQVFQKVESELDDETNQYIEDIGRPSGSKEDLLAYLQKFVITLKDR